MLQPEEIADLADHLRGEGYQSTLHQVLAAQTVVCQESLRDSELGSLVRLVTVLRPIFSTTPDEQERFEKLYLEWLRTRSGRPRAITASTPSTPPPEPPRIHWRMKLAVPSLLIVPMLTAWFLWQDLRPREAVGHVVADNQPVAHATVKLGDRAVTTDEQGAFKVPFKNDDMPLPLLVEMKGYIPSQSQVGQAILENRKWFYLSPIEWDVQYHLREVQLARETAPITPRSVPPAPVQEPTSPKLTLEKLRTVPPPMPAWWERLSYSTALVTLIPILLVLLWLIYRLGRRAVLKRQSSRIPPELKQVQVQAGTQRLFPSLSLRYVTQRLRQTRFEESTELDVARTIQLTMNRGGLFTPVFGSKREPSYVALIDRATVADHQANVAAQVVKDLAKGYVLVRQYEFDEQPTILRKVDPLHAKPKQSEGVTAVATRVEIMSLGEVTVKFPNSRLLCFAEPITCFDPLTGKLRPWVEALEAWEERFLFTPGIRGQWGQAERILSRRGFHVIPLTHLGLRLFSHLLEQDGPRGESARETTREQRGTYERTPQRWLERHPPSPETIAKLMADLRQELGSEGILWLAACAAYPEIHWALTLEWGVCLFGQGSTAETLLPKLTSLVWFRHAFMPDWFRTALYDQLTEQQAERISQELSDIISALNPESGDTLQLKIAMPPGAGQQTGLPDGRFSAWFQELRRRLAIQEMGRAADQGNPMRDYVMLQYLSGKQGKALTPYAPKALLALLFPKGQPWLGFRPLFLIMTAVMVSTGLWWWENPAPVPLPSPIVDVGFWGESNEVILKRKNGIVERWGQNDDKIVLLESGEQNTFTDRLTTVKMGQLRVSDPKGRVELVYQKEGQLRVVSREDGRELAREPAPAAQIASLQWPRGFDAFLVVTHRDVPEVVNFKGLESLYRQEIVRREEDAAELRRRMEEKALAEAKAREAETRAKVKGVKIAEAKRLAELAAKKKAEATQQVTDVNNRPEVQPPEQIQQQTIKHPTLLFQALVNQAYKHPSDPMFMFRFDGEMVIVTHKEVPIPLATSQLSLFPEDQWVSLASIDQHPLPVMVMRRGRSLLAQWLPATVEPAQQQARKQPLQEQPAEKLPSKITGKDGAPMVLVSAGEFMMGSVESDKNVQNDERPAHPVYLDAFYIDQYEVTTARYAKFFEATNRPQPEYWSANVMSKHGNKPVVGVDWNDATAYCSWAGKRLPTEAEWEKAARGTDQRVYPWGNQPPNEQRANLMRCCDFKDYGVLADVGSYEQGKSPYGAYDMAGNVWEWTADWYEENYYSTSPARNPKGPSSGQDRVLRGGSWATVPVDVRSADRDWYTPAKRDDNIGFRCAQDGPK